MTDTGARSLDRTDLHALFMSVPWPMAVHHGPEHTVELVNEEFLRLTLASRSNVIGKPFRDAFPDLDAQGMSGILDHVFQTGQTQILRSFRVLPGLDEGYWDVTIQAIRDSAGQVIGLLTCSMEITEQVRAAERMKALADTGLLLHDELDLDRPLQARLAEQRKDEFLAALAHELRNPLAPIRSGLELIRRKAGPGVERECEILERQVVHLTRLVDDLLDVSRIMRGKIELKKERQELHPVIARGVESARPIIHERGHYLGLDVASSGLVIDIDAVRFAQVISNLLTNAARYTPPGGHIAIEARPEGNLAVIRMRDNGIGIPGHMLSTVFDLFVQGDRRLDRSEGGLGIGLTLARKVVELHDGSIEALSEGLGKGSEFVIRLPLCAASEVQRSAPAEAATPIVPPAKKRVLVVDDNMDAADTLAALISLAGHEVATAYDGHRALIVATEFRPDVALLDIGLPGLDGFELARRFRAHSYLGDVRLVAVTGYGQDFDRSRGEQAGFEEYCVKPVGPEELMRLLRTQASKRT